MKYLVTLLLSCVFCFANAEPVGVPAQVFNHPLLIEKCDEGCLVLDDKDFEELKAQIAKLVRDAYDQGKADGNKGI